MVYSYISALLRESPKTAKSAFLKLNPDAELLAVMLVWLEKAKQSQQWQDKSKIPHPATWLNQRRWEGDPPPMASEIPQARAPAQSQSRTAVLHAMLAEIEAKEAANG